MKFATVACSFLLLAGCRSDNGNNPDAANPDAPIAGGNTILQLKTGTPVIGNSYTINNVVVVATSLNTYSAAGVPRYGNMYVQDKGGGRNAGVHIFCDTTPKNPPACTTAMRDMIGNLHSGQVVNITGLWDQTSFGSPAFIDPEMKVPVITDTGTTYAVTAVTVTAAEVKKEVTALTDLTDVYVRISTPMTVSSLTPAWFAATKVCAANGDASPAEIQDAGLGFPYYGFYAKSGSDEVAISSSDYKKAHNWCVPDCPGWPCTSGNMVGASDTFAVIAGVATVDTYNTNGRPNFVKVLPTIPGDIAR